MQELPGVLGGRNQEHDRGTGSNRPRWDGHKLLVLKIFPLELSTHNAGVEGSKLHPAPCAFKQPYFARHLRPTVQTPMLSPSSLFRSAGVDHARFDDRQLEAILRPVAK
jgi:hypothetical protein